MFRRGFGGVLARSLSSSASGVGRVGFVGLGNMGASMAANLLGGGFEVSVFDLSTTAMEKLEGLGAKPGASARDVAAESEVVVTMLPSTPHVRAVCEEELFPTLEKGQMVIDCSTIDPVESQKLAKQAKEAGIVMVDAPVSGGVLGAEAGTLTFMVGSEESDFEKAKHILDPMGANFVHCGAPGTGQIAKVCNNLILGISMCGVAEAMNLGVQLGADPKTLAAIINTSSGRCWSSDTYNPVPGVMDGVPASNGYAGGFGTMLMRKDLGLAANAAFQVGVPLNTGLAALNAYTASAQNGNHAKDFSAYYQFLAKQIK